MCVLRCAWHAAAAWCVQCFVGPSPLTPLPPFLMSATAHIPASTTVPHEILMSDAGGFSFENCGR